MKLVWSNWSDGRQQGGEVKVLVLVLPACVATILPPNSLHAVCDPVGQLYTPIVPAIKRALVYTLTLSPSVSAAAVCLLPGLSEALAGFGESQMDKLT